jgi:ParB/RepB/Spo0J family partition protein
MKTKKKLAITDVAEAAIVIDAKPLEDFSDGLMRAVGLPTKADKEAAQAHFEAEPGLPAGAHMMALSELVESDTNPRKHFTGLDELAASIAKVGILVPLLVRPNEGQTYEVVAGHRRFRAAQLAGLTEVPVDVRELSDVQTLEVQLIENVQRSDLSPLEEADGYQRLMEVAGYTAEQVAAKAGKSKAWVYSRLKLLALGPEGRKMLEGGALGATVAIALARIPSHLDQSKALERLVDKESPLSTREALEYLQEEFCVALKGAPFDRKDSMLLPDAPACVACPKRSGAGTPGIYDDLSSGDWCTDSKCFLAKCRASWDYKSARFEKDGAEALTIEQGAKLFKHENTLGYGSKYVLAAEPVSEDSKKRTWAELLEKVPEEDKPKLFVAPDANMALRKLYVHDDALHAVAKCLGLKWAEKKKAQAEEKEKRSDPEANADEAEARLLRDEVVRDVVFAAAAKVRKEGMTPAMARLVARAELAASEFTEYLDEREVRAGKAEEWLREANQNEALAYVTANALQHWVGGTWGGFAEELTDVAKCLGLNLEELMKAKLETPKGGKK